MAKGIKYKKLSLEDDLSGVMKLMKLFPKQEQSSEEEIRRCLTAPPGGAYGIWLARDTLQAEVGFSIWYHESREEAYFWLIGVGERYRNNGLSAKLLDLPIKEITQLGYSRMVLETFESCEKMKRLCLQRGFEEIGRTPCQWDSKDDTRVTYTLELKKDKNI